MLRNVFGGCVSDRSSEAMRHQKIRFGAPLSTALKNGYLPIPMVELLVYVAKEGVNTVDIFRRPGNPSDIRRVVKRLSEGKPVIFSNYSFYTLASVIKRFLISIPGGVFTEEGEELLLKVLTIGHKMEQYDAIHENTIRVSNSLDPDQDRRSVGPDLGLNCLPSLSTDNKVPASKERVWHKRINIISSYIHSRSTAHQQLLSLLFGIWFTMVHNSKQNYMSTEALSRSVAGSMFHTCAMDPAKVEKASRIMQLLIDNFGVARVFGQHNIEYFAEVTHIEIHVRETFKYQYSYPGEEILPPISEETYMDKALTRLHSSREHEHEKEADGDEILGPINDSTDIGMEPSSNLLVTSTVSVPEVSLVPSPEVSKRPKSVDDNLNESHNASQPKPSLSRYNSVKRKQLERLRQRSDWFLGPSVASSPVINVQPPPPHHEPLRTKHSGNSVTRASSEGAVLDTFSDGESVFSDNTSRSESPASEPARTNTAAVCIHRDILHSDTFRDVSPEMEDGHSNDMTDDEMTESEICYFMIEHKYGEPKS